MREYEGSRDYWNRYFHGLRVSEQEQDQSEEEENLDSVGSELVETKLRQLAATEKVLDFGCGSGWATLLMAAQKKGQIFGVDYAEEAVEWASEFAKKNDLSEYAKFLAVDSDWVYSVEDDTYDSFFSSNCFDIMPTDTAKEIFLEMKRFMKPNATIIICLNAYFDEEACEKRNLVKCAPHHYTEDGVLRLVCYTDDEWREILTEYFKVEELHIFCYEGEPETNKRRMFVLKNK